MSNKRKRVSNRTKLCKAEETAIWRRRGHRKDDFSLAATHHGDTFGYRYRIDRPRRVHVGSLIAHQDRTLNMDIVDLDTNPARSSSRAASTWSLSEQSSQPGSLRVAKHLCYSIICRHE